MNRGRQLRRWWRVVGRLVQEELGGTIRNGQWLLLVLLVAVAGSCGSLRASTQPAAVPVA